MTTRPGASGLLLVTGYLPVADDEYEPEPFVGACLGASVIRRMMQIVITDDVGLLHVHLHEHCGTPGPSVTDERDVPDFARALSRVARSTPCGYLILSYDRAYGQQVSPGERDLTNFEAIRLIGGPLGFLTRRRL